jgi:hypothetical protein
VFRMLPQVSDEFAAAQQQALNMERMSYLEQHEHGELSDKAASYLQMLMAGLQANSDVVTR